MRGNLIKVLIQENTNRAQETFISCQQSGCPIQSLKTRQVRKNENKLESEKQQICENMVLSLQKL